MAGHVIVRRSVVARGIVAAVVVVGRVLGWMGLAFMMAAGAGGLGGCANDKKVMAVADTMHTGLKPVVMEDAELQGYFQKIGERIVQTATALDKEGYGPKSHTESSDDNAWMFSDKMRFYLVNSKTLNAFTTGGEHMYVYNELFLQCKSEDELAAVMAHEYAHVYARHVKNGMDRQTGQNVGTGAVAVGAGLASYFFGGGGLSSSVSTAQSAAGVASSAGKFVGMGFTRKDEDEADAIGFVFYTRAGWDPDHFADFFKHMIEAGYDGTPATFSDHPKLSSRVENTEKRARKLPSDAKQWRKPPIADEKQFAALRQRAARLAESMPSGDQAVQKAQAMLAAFPSCVARSDQPGQSSARAKVRSDAFNAQFAPK
jgi:predicted Zn-dependent protease